MEEGSFKIQNMVSKLETVLENPSCVVAKQTGSVAMTIFFYENSEY